jgi:hypothetical protein
LIKSKLDQLNNAQPLKPFLGTIGSVQSMKTNEILEIKKKFHIFVFIDIINKEKLSPKEFIKEYQLEKSHIAFTLCTKVSKDAYEIHPETTIVSSVITELPPTVSKAKPGMILAIDLLKLISRFFFKKQIQQIRERKLVVQIVHIVLI